MLNRVRGSKDFFEQFERFRRDIPESERISFDFMTRRCIQILLQNPKDSVYDGVFKGHHIRRRVAGSIQLGREVKQFSLFIEPKTEVGSDGKTQEYPYFHWIAVDPD